MKRAAFLSLPAFILLASAAFAGEPAPAQKPSPTPAKSKVAAKKSTPVAEAKRDQTSSALDQLFDKDSGIRHPELHFWGSADISVTSVRR